MILQQRMESIEKKLTQVRHTKRDTKKRKRK